MVDNPEKTLTDLVKHLGRYPEEAFIFVREGLGDAADQVHGPESKAHQALQHYLTENDIDWESSVGWYRVRQSPIYALPSCPPSRRRLLRRRRFR